MIPSILTTLRYSSQSDYYPSTTSTSAWDFPGLVLLSTSDICMLRKFENEG